MSLQVHDRIGAIKETLGYVVGQAIHASAIEVVEAEIKDQFDRGQATWKPLHWFTVRRKKGETVILTDKGHLKNAIETITEGDEADGFNLDVFVGVFKSPYRDYGATHEFGAVIPVTDKMRAWLHANGLHLKATTTHITIPRRSFIADTIDREETLAAYEELVRLYLVDYFAEIGNTI